jgi:hypothetical protein
MTKVKGRKIEGLDMRNFRNHVLNSHSKDLEGSNLEEPHHLGGQPCSSSRISNEKVQVLCHSCNTPAIFKYNNNNKRSQR